MVSGYGAWNGPFEPFADAADRVYFEREIRPLLDDPLIQFIGEIGDEDKPVFLGGAFALLFPVDWPEPFGHAAPQCPRL